MNWTDNLCASQYTVKITEREKLSVDRAPLGLHGAPLEFNDETSN